MSSAESEARAYRLIVNIRSAFLRIHNELDSLREKSRPLPASKASIESMPRITVTEIGKECAICLEEFLVGGEAREMPCKHWFHSVCVEKWLGIHGSCPLCRFVMPVEEKKFAVAKPTG